MTRMAHRLIHSFQRPLVALLLAILLGTSWSQVGMAKGEQGVWGVVRTQTSTVYAAPWFDAKVLAQLPANTRVVMSKSTFGDRGPQFYKVKINLAGKSVIGYILDAEITSEKPGVLAPRLARNEKNPSDTSSAKSQDGSRPNPNARIAKTGKTKKHKRAKEKQPMLFSHYAGVVVGMTNFKEKISGIHAEQSLLTYGIKLTGPDLLFKGPITEFNFLLHNGAPDYYNAYSGIKPTGFIIWTDGLLLYPFFNRDNSMISFEAGPLMVITDFKVFRNGSLMDLFAVNGGLSTAISGAYRLGSVALRLEVKYMFENQSYLAVLGSLQSEF